MDTNGNNNLFYPNLSYEMVGLCFDVHNELGRFAREKQYATALEERLKNNGYEYKKECSIGNSGNTADFIVENKIIIELKARPRLTRDHFRQTQNYLQASGLKLGLLINFTDPDLKPKRIVHIEKNRHS